MNTVPAILQRRPAAVANAWPVYLKLCVVACAWGGTYIAGHKVATEMPHFTAAALRFLIAAAVLLSLLCWREGWPRLSWRQWLGTAMLGVTGVALYNLAFLGALERLPAGRSALVVALNPVVVAIATALLFRERLGWHRWFGIGVALFGVAVVLVRGDFAHASAAVGVGELMMFGGVLAWTAYTLLGRRLLAGPGAPSALAVTALGCTWGALFLSIGAIGEAAEWHRGLLSLDLLGALAYLGAIGTALGFLWFAQGVHAIGAARAAMFHNLVPVTGVALSAVLLGEPLGSSMLVGGLLAVVGVTLANLPKLEVKVSIRIS